MTTDVEVIEDGHPDSADPLNRFDLTVPDVDEPEEGESDVLDFHQHIGVVMV